VFPARPFDRVDVDWKIGEKPKSTLQASGFFAQHHFLPVPEDFHFLALESKLPRQAHELAIPRFEELSKSHRSSVRPHRHMR
jgi:hypothetical protein